MSRNKTTATTTKRADTVPEDLVIHLRKTIPGFRKEAAHHQLALAKMVWAGSSKRKQHSHLDGAMSFYCRELDSEFGRGGLQEINARLGFFIDSGQWFSSSGETKAYWFADQVKESRDTYLARRWRKVTRLLKADGAALKTIPAAVASRCEVPCDHIPARSWPLFRTREVLHGVIESIQREQTT